MSLIHLVSSGLKEAKKPWVGKIAGEHRYLNYGLLGMAGVIDDLNIGIPKVRHGGHTEPRHMATEMCDERDWEVVLVSIPSYFSLGWCSEFVSHVRRLRPDCRVVIGGRWVVDGNSKWLKQQLPNDIEVVEGHGEEYIPKLLSNTGGNNGVSDRPLRLPTLRYQYLCDYSEFTPSVEVSRGCGMGCEFCGEADAPMIFRRSPRELVENIAHTVEFYGADRINFYFEASLFVCSYSWATEFCDEIGQFGTKVFWRCETRVDTLQKNVLEKLAHSGLRVLDIGLESASRTQLARMGKTRDPDRYLRRASELLKSCSDLGIWAKVNCLLYPGETDETIAETWQWLSDRISDIKGISAWPLMLYGPNAIHSDFYKSICVYGAKARDISKLRRNGYSELDLSKTIDYHRAVDYCRRICRDLMTAKDYYDLKSFSYLKRGYKWKDFVRDVAGEDPELLPFSLVPELPRMHHTIGEDRGAPIVST
jgi:hypothetical protein